MASGTGREGLEACEEGGRGREKTDRADPGSLTAELSHTRAGLGSLGQKPALRTPVSREGSKLDYWTRREWGGLAQGVYTVERKSGGLRGGEE